MFNFRYRTLILGQWVKFKRIVNRTYSRTINQNTNKNVLGCHVLLLIVLNFIDFVICIWFIMVFKITLRFLKASGFFGLNCVIFLNILIIIFATYHNVPFLFAEKFFLVLKGILYRFFIKVIEIFDLVNELMI